MSVGCKEHEVQAWLDAWAARPEPESDVRLVRVSRDEWTPALLRSLYALAITMSAEDYDNFERHALTNQCVHLFRLTTTDALAGFQFWWDGAAKLSDQDQHLVIGGKLRILPAYRRRALHLRSALAIYADVLRTYPGRTVQRMSFASLFGFVSIARAVRDHHVIATDTLPPHAQWLCGAASERALDSGYQFDPSSGLVHVNIRPTAEQLAGYPESFFESPLARAYIGRNRDWRTNGCYLAFGFPLSTVNLQTIDSAITERRPHR